MRSGKFWHLWANPGFEKIIASQVKLKTFAEVKQAIKYAYLDEDLLELLQEPAYRASLLIVLIQWWFPDKLDVVEQIMQADES